MSYLKDAPLGQTSDYVDQYAPELLYPVPRALARESLALENGALPFQGEDLWTGYELSWLDQGGKPRVALAEIRVPCTSDNIIESKSLKLYLNSFANSRYTDADAVREIITADLGKVAGEKVTVRILSLGDAAAQPVWHGDGVCVDELDLTIDTFAYDAALLTAGTGEDHQGELYSHLLRSHCPVTNQPDWGTVVVRYEGRPIDPAGFLRYVVSLRNHQGFHEQIVEQMFVDLQRQCAPAKLSVLGRFTRRGGLDINPFRSNFEPAPENLRTIRQ
ncbi:7-cyano-7-deazaguanine reductase [Alcanivorax xiamenensis]|uniref:NADPH-dependent 7-cyano-7-deazaguanine reductase n=1 Tax=Alcanivorax xiamenensis TaxID=1177156 RepID=A0ABQ6Y9J6_9GAMM|nr:NADPH-dependent 7-cyano-7-deazaguanine reductase QueF [Alcanivorax xiamenensis]KAF0806154.1 7-cyano-7-deazaguanine reductase [Alcanivorax xiamenensis]